MAKRRSLPPHIVLPSGMWRFVKKGSRSRAISGSRSKKVIKVARSKGRRFKGRSFHGGIGGMKTMIAPVLGGLADSVIDPISPIDGIGGIIVGFVLKSNTTRDIGFYKAGMSAGNMFMPKLLGGGGTTSQGGMY